MWYRGTFAPAYSGGDVEMNSRGRSECRLKEKNRRKRRTESVNSGKSGMMMIVLMCDEEFIDEGDVSGDDVSKKTPSKIIKSRRISGASTLLQTSRRSCRDKRHQIAESGTSEDQIMMFFLFFSLFHFDTVVFFIIYQPSLPPTCDIGLGEALQTELLGGPVPVGAGQLRPD